MIERQKLTLLGDHLFMNIPEAGVIEPGMLENLEEPTISVEDWLKAVEIIKEHNVRFRPPLCGFVERPQDWVISYSHHHDKTFKGLYNLFIGVQLFSAWNPITCILRGKEWFLKNGGSK